VPWRGVAWPAREVIRVVSTILTSEGAMTSDLHGLGFEDIGPWSEIKLAIVREYASAYSRILAARKFHHLYIDAFAGGGTLLSRSRDELIPGSPINALDIDPPFREFHFIDLSSAKVTQLRDLTKGRTNVTIHNGDANVVLRSLFPTILWDEYKRALCLLDPYGLHYQWDVVHAAGQMRTIEIFLHFSILDANRNVLRRNPDQIDPEQARRLTAAWGDASWRDVAYTRTGLFQFENKVTNEEIARAYQERLRRVAGFAYVPDPLPIRNSKGVVIYYLYFAAQQPVAAKIVRDIFRKYRLQGVRH
jgi:three-Cys-motif partner protein